MLALHLCKSGHVQIEKAFTDDEILDLLQAIDEQYIKRFGMNPYDRLMKESKNV